MAKPRTHILKNTAKQAKFASPRLVPKHLAKEEFARRLYELMISKGWSQSDLARASGLARNAISVYMRGASLPSPTNLEALAKVFGVDKTDLLANYAESAIDRDNPELELRVSPGDPKSAWLRVNRMVPTRLAVKIMALLENENADD